MSEDEQQLNPGAPAFVAGGNNNNGGVGSVKLAPFWPQAPALWFSQAECLFTVKNITDEHTRYCFVVGALQHESLRLVADIVESPPPLQPYTVLKDRLMASHVLSGYRRAEQLFNMPPLGSRKPSALMAAMLEVCPRGEAKTELFAFQFLQRLPRELRVLLAKVDKKDPKALADQADELWGLHDFAAAAIAPVMSGEQGEDGTVAAVRKDNGGRGGRGGRGRRGRGGTGGGSSGSGGKQPQEPDISRDARLAAGLCLKHWRYGDQASSCTQPCAWPGNGPAGGN